MNTKLQRIKETLKSVLSQFQEERITSDKGIIDVQKAGDEIAVGDTIVLVDEEGVETQAESGEYTLTDGTILKVEDGKIVDIVVPEMEAPAEEPAQEEEKPAEEEEAPAEDPVDERVDDEIGTDTPEEREEAPAEEEEKPAEEEAPEEEPAAEEEAPAQEEENAEVAALKAEIAEKDARIAELEARIAELEKKPAAEPATEEFKKVNKIYKTGDEKLDRLAKIMGA